MEGIAIIGMSGRFPGAGSVHAFWDNLVRGVESISRFSDAELEMPPPPDAGSAFVNARGIVEGADLFDAPFFGCNAREAELLDPQHRILLECAWEALESAGYDPERYPGLIGVWAGSGINSYLLYNIVTGHGDLARLVGGYQQGESAAQFSNDRDFLATRIAYKLNLKGPSLTVQTACSTSLVAVAQACQALWSYQTDMALAGGVSISFPQRRGYVYQEGAIASADGRTRTFDAAAQGTVFSSGAGIVLLKRLEDALADGDSVTAVIKGASINNDGAGKVSFTAPSVDGQAEVIQMAQALAGVPPASVSYVEAHGTGTPLGDPIEVAGLTQAFRAGGATGKNFCALGSLKTNVGHMDIASGIAALIKTSLALKHRLLPPTLHFNAPNPHLDLANSPFYVNTALLDWPAAPDGGMRHAGVSSFGVGGTNAHAVLEEAPPAPASDTGPRERRLFILSARTETALDAATDNLVRHLRARPADDPADVSYTLQLGRRAFGCRRVVAAADLTDAADALERRDGKRVFSQSAGRRNPPVAFLFPGQGAQAVNMGAVLYRTEPVFRAEMDRGAELLRPHLDDADLRNVFRSAEQLNETRFTQPSLFVFGYALARLWMSWGVNPGVMLGHSVGEYVAACVSGVFTLEDALGLVAERARLVQARPRGVMLAVRLAEADLTPLLAENGPGLSMAAINAPGLCVVSGNEEATAAFERLLEGRRIVSRRLKTSHAFHSAMMDPVVEPFTALVKKVSLRPPGIPFVSNVTGRLITDAEATDPVYWARHLREAVRFADGIAELLRIQPAGVLLELGPGQTLAPMVRQHPAAAKDRGVAVFSALQDGRDEGAAALTTLGRLWLEGVEVDWRGFHAGTRRQRVPLPTYPFERKRYWIEPPKTVSEPSANRQEESPMPNPEPVPAALPARKTNILAKLRSVLKELSGQDQSGADPGATFLELGFDSLFLTQVAGAFRKEFGIKVTFRQLLEDFSTMDTLAGYLDAQLPPEAMQPTPPPPLAPLIRQAPPAAAAPPVPRDAGMAQSAAASTVPAAGRAEGGSTLERVVQEQLRLMAQQLEMLRGGVPAPAAPVSAPETVPEPFTPAAASGSTTALPSNNEPKAFGPYRPIDKAPGGGLTDRQRQHLDALIARYTARTPQSKIRTQETRAHLADPRTVSGFRQQWKEAVYPIIVEHSAGCRFRDIDGNEYIDMTMGFGTNLLGHSPPFVTAALQEQVRRGIEVGPQTPVAGKVAALLCELTGTERAAFTNTGSEAVLAAVRLARTVTGRTRIATCGGFHGINDEVLVRANVVDGKRRSVPVAPGIPENSVRDVLVVDYGTAEGLELLRAHAHELAAVLIEPVQSRRPDLQPREFLHAVREITQRAGCALVFDEIINGFRCHLGGAQAYFGVRADIVTYGKIIGGGMPIGAVCGKAEYLDALDGGAWQYGDGSFPEVGVTFFAGTYIRHPLTMAASWAILSHLKREGEGLQNRLNERAAQAVGEINEFCRQSGVPLRLEHFSSFFLPHFADDIKYGGLLFLHLRDKGVHIWEGRPCFFSTAHTEADIAFVVRAFEESVAELQAAGFLPGEPLVKLGANGRNGHHLPPVETGANGAAPARPPFVTSDRPTERAPASTASGTGTKPLQFSLYFFGNYPAAYDPDKYRLILEGARYADQHDFTAIWLPERHFHALGGFSPNPSLLAAALARDTERIALRGGSVVLPLHHPVRVAEEWSMVDNLSKGRVGMSIASGWHPNDFIFAPDRFERRREICVEDIETIQKLWRGESLPMRAGAGADFDVKLHPMPVQARLPVWFTCIHEDSFARAGELGVGVLGYLMNQTVEELAAKIARYREALSRAGHDPATGHVTILVHTFIGDDAAAAREQARGPLKDYLRSYLDNSQKKLESQNGPVDVEAEDLDYLLEKSHNDYVQGKALIGSAESCAAVADRLRGIGVDEIGCFIDFGVDPDAVLAGLTPLNRLREHFAPAAVAANAAPAERTILLTESQTGLWVLAQTDEDALRTYNESTTLDLRGPLDAGRLHGALRQAMNRHEALRTTIRADGEAQIIHPEGSMELPTLDLSKTAPDERSALLAECFRAFEQADFDCSRGSLIRGQLFKLADDHHLLTLTFHHLVGNGPSYWVFLEELVALYEAQGSGGDARLETPMQLGEYVRWRAEEVARNGADDERFWLEQFSGGVPALELPTDRPRPSIRSHRGGRAKLTLPRELTAALRKTAASRRGSLFMVLLSAFEVLMHRLSSQEDVVVGASFEGEVRTLPGGAHLFANTTNVLPLRSRVGGETRFSELLAATKDRVLSANDHQNYFFGRLIKKLGLAHDPSRPAVFSVYFNYENGKFQRDLSDGLRVELLTEDVPYRSPRDTAMVELYLNVAEIDGDLHCECDYSRDLFDGATIQRWLGHYRTLLEAIISNPDEPVWTLPLMDAAQRERVLAGWNDTAADYPLATATLHGLIEAQAARTPAAAALVFEGSSLTYGQLDARANQLANHLRAQGIGPGTLVGIGVERSLEMVVGLLGILKAGGAYVPLDPDYPAERLAFMLADAKVPVLLTQERLKEKLPADHGARVICLDTGWEAVAGESSAAPAVNVRPEDLAYVIYTSGSTGQPKGAMNTHQGICNRLLWMQDAYRLDARDRVMQKTPFSFDVSVWEFFWPLMTGAALVIARPRGHQDTRYLAGLISEQAVTTLHFVPPMLAVFLEERALAEKCRSLRQVICSGEALPFELQERFFEVFADPAVKLHNLYGPTEAAVDVTYWECQRGGHDPVVPIGRPIANTQIYLLDARGQAVPAGVPGELHIGGAGVGRGYLGRPELTAEKFVPDLFRGDSPARLYKTGDLARWRDDGSLVYLGRLDHQVKVRGFRIELGEIEAAINAFPGVRESVAVVREDAPGERRLAAYVVMDDDRGGDGEAGIVGAWHSQWEGMHSQGIEASRALGSNLTPTDALLRGMQLENHDQQVSEFEQQTLARIRAMKPRRLLEIGGGTGNQALALAPECEQYVVTDFSPPAIEYLRARAPGNLTILQRDAADLSGIEMGAFDTVTMHSVCQYFPSADYLRRVVEGMVRAARPGGYVYVGDVQSFALLEALHLGKQAQRAPDTLPIAELRERVRRSAAREIEQVVDPGFFHALAAELPAVRRVECLLRRGHMYNEATKFHYDVILHIGETLPDLVPARWLDWARDGLDLAALRWQLTDARPDVLAVRTVPNARVRWEMAAREEMDAAVPPVTAGELRERVTHELAADAAVDPEDLWALAEELGYQAAISYSSEAAGADGRCEVIFHRVPGVPVFPVPASHRGKAPEAFANQPRQALAAGGRTDEDGQPETTFASRLRSYLKGKLPEYMVPAAFVPLPRLPLTPNGKVDRRALPAPDFSGAAASASDAHAPATPLEKYLAALWCEILGVGSIGTRDNFFEAGGDSLLGVRMVNRLRENLDEHLSLVAIFEAPTILALAALLETNYAAAVARLCGLSGSVVDDRRAVAAEQGINEGDVRRMRQIIGRRPAPPAVPRAEKNPRAVFVLSPMRSGSTLLRVMLAGNPRLFSPPELQLLQFETLVERRDAFTGYEHSILESTLRALMQVHGIDVDAAQAMMSQREDRAVPTRDFYREMQQWVTPRLLVDKTPEYAMDIEVLRRAEAFFEDALYIHLARHPLGMIRSYEQGRFLLESPYRGQHDFTARQMAELTWLISHQNIRDFLREVPAARQRLVRFEDIVAAPQPTMQALGEFLGVGYDPGMVQPYDDGRTKMTDGAHELSVQVGDPNFYKHGAIKPEVASRWKADYREDFLSEATWEMAVRFGYENPFHDLPPAAAPVPTALPSRTLSPISAVSREARRVKRSKLFSE